MVLLECLIVFSDYPADLRSFTFNSCGLYRLSSRPFFIIAALLFGFTSLIFFWWAGLALLDLITALYCIASEKEEFRLVPYALIYRMVFILIVDICKAMSTVEEFLGIRMNWGKLERVG